MDRSNRTYLVEGTAPVCLLKDEQIFYVKYEVYLTVCIYWKDELFYTVFEFSKRENSCEIVVLSDKLTCRSNSIKILVSNGKNVPIRRLLNFSLIFLLKLCNTSFKGIGFFLGYIDTTVGLMS
jgi:hypothetical protein